MDVVSSRIINLASPVNNNDAVNKAFLSSAIETGSSTIKIWGEGRPAVTLQNTSGECTNVIGGKTIKISRNDVAVHWDASAAGCPAGWWVCNQSERGTAACGVGNLMSSYNCKDKTGGPDTLENTTEPQAWVSDKYAATKGTIVSRRTDTPPLVDGREVACYTFPVWCCAYQ